MENSSGRYAAAPVSSPDPGTEPLPPARVPRLPAELLPCLLVRGPAPVGHLGHDELPGEQPAEPGGQAQRRLRARDLGQVRQPLRDRRRVAVHDVVDARRAAVDRSVAAAASVIWMNDQIPVPPPITGTWRFRTLSKRTSEAPGP